MHLASVVGALGVLALLGVSAVGAAKPAGNQPLRGNTASALLQQSQGQGAANAAAQVQLLVGLNFVSQNGMPSLPQYILDTATPQSRYYRKYLTPQAFNADYLPSSSAIFALEQYLTGFGLTASQTQQVNGTTYTSNDYVYVSGPVSAVEQAFSVPINAYTYKGRSFLANPEDPQLPTDYQGYDLQSMVSGISGMLTFNALHTMQVNASQSGAGVAQGVCANAGYADCSAPTGLSPQDTQGIYDANLPNITGAGETIAIATLAPFLTQDPLQFWSYYGIHRTGTLQEIGVDQSIPAQGASGAGQGGSETSLDVEQSGAMAPGANIEVYVAPNTNNGFVDVFNALVNGVGGALPTVSSVSWGEAEEFTTAGYATLLDQQFEQGASEGISMFDASGDYGAYDAYGYYGQNGLAVDVPGDGAYVTAVGGTTLGASETQGVSGIYQPSQLSCMPQQEQAWGWDYLVPCYQAFGLQNAQRAQASFYPIGSGGGFSLYTPEPSWQQAYGGALQSQTGKGVPDVSLNADPFTGYSIYDSSSVETTASAPWTDGWGGTSFASPNWAGIAALLDQANGTPLGFLPPQLYALGANSGMRDITAGDNWHYSAASGWDAATGLGVPDVAQLSATLSGR
ncbi:MAG: S53 family peptidase [Thermaerobacter sp.]|nr:S53 family peptidase [Thermaerobacter sp.]